MKPFSIALALTLAAATSVPLASGMDRSTPVVFNSIIEKVASKRLRPRNR
jgi:hypothetical protein